MEFLPGPCCNAFRRVCICEGRERSMGQGEGNGGALLGYLPLGYYSLNNWSQAGASGEGGGCKVTSVGEMGRNSRVQKDAAEGKRTMSGDEKVSIEVPRNTSSTKTNECLVILPGEV